MPKHLLDDIRFLIEADAWDLGTRICRRDVQNLGLTRDEQKAILLAVTEHDHRSEIEVAGWDQGEIQADYYRLWYDEAAGTRCPPRKGMLYYLKFGIYEFADESQLCVVVSFHLDNRP